MNRNPEKLSLNEAIRRIRLQWKGATVDKLCHGRVRIRDLSGGHVSERVMTYHEAIQWAQFLSRDGHTLRGKDHPAKRYVKRMEHRGRNIIRNVVRLLTGDPDGDYDVRIPKRREDIWCYD